VLTLLTLATVWLGWPPTPATPPPGVTLTDLRGIDDLRDRFNRDSDAARVILVLARRTYSTQLRDEDGGLRS
jgi:hypothetical protein